MVNVGLFDCHATVGLVGAPGGGGIVGLAGDMGGSVIVGLGGVVTEDIPVLLSSEGEYPHSSHELPSVKISPAFTFLETIL